ncbi:NAD(P)-dependent oxidoreductase [Acidobacteriota bacterium]
MHGRKKKEERMDDKIIGWIGTGVMGNSMAGNLMKAGYKVFVTNRTKEKARELTGRGAAWCETPAAVARKAKTIFTIVGFPGDVESVIFGSDGLINNAAPGSTLIDMTTSRPSLAVRISEAAKEKSIDTIDAPVSGGNIKTKKNKLAIMANNKHSVYEKILPLFRILGENIALMGGPKNNQHTKMSNQILVASTMIDTIKTLLYTYKTGLDRGSVIDIIGKKTAAS